MNETAAVEVAAAVVAEVPGVAGLHAGEFGEVATYLPNRKVIGIRQTADSARTEVHIVVHLDAPVHQTAARVRAALAAVVGGAVDVIVEDVVEPQTGAR